MSVSSSDIDLAWAAGLFDGEGSVYLDRGYEMLKIGMSDCEVIERIASIVGGKVFGPYQQKGGTCRPMWFWAVRRSEAENVAGRLLPFLSKPKAEKVEAMFPDLTKPKRSGKLSRDSARMTRRR